MNKKSILCKLRNSCSDANSDEVKGSVSTFMMRCVKSVGRVWSDSEHVFSLSDWCCIGPHDEAELVDVALC